MKLFKILSHPYPLIICFLLIIISGENWGGFYLLYILMALPFGALHALLAVGGIACLVISYHGFKRTQTVYRVLNLAGVLLLFASLYYFFWADKQHYNYGTFQEAVPVLTLVVTALLAIGFIITTLSNPDSRLRTI